MSKLRGSAATQERWSTRFRSKSQWTTARRKPPSNRRIRPRASARAWFAALISIKTWKSSLQILRGRLRSHCRFLNLRSADRKRLSRRRKKTGNPRSCSFYRNKKFPPVLGWQVRSKLLSKISPTDIREKAIRPVSSSL